MAAQIPGRFTMESNPIACYGHCYQCGRATRHEICHECLDAYQAAMAFPQEWERFNDPPEACDFDDDHCPHLIKFRAWSSTYVG